MWNEEKNEPKLVIRLPGNNDEQLTDLNVTLVCGDDDGMPTTAGCWYFRTVRSVLWFRTTAQNGSVHYALKGSQSQFQNKTNSKALYIISMTPSN